MRRLTSGFLSAQVLAKSRCQFKESPLSVPMLSEILPPDGAAWPAGAEVGAAEVAAAAPAAGVVAAAPAAGAVVGAVVAGAAPPPQACRSGIARARTPLSFRIWRR